MPNPPNKCRNPDHRFSEANGRCLTCKAANQARYRGRHPEQVRSYNQKYLKAKRERRHSVRSAVISEALRKWR